MGCVRRVGSISTILIGAGLLGMSFYEGRQFISQASDRDFNSRIQMERRTHSTVYGFAGLMSLISGTYILSLEDKKRGIQ